MAFRILITHLAAYWLKRSPGQNYHEKLSQNRASSNFVHIFMAYDSHDHGVYTLRYFCASNSSVSKHITLDSDLRPMIMNYHEIIIEFASCRVG